MAKTTEHSPRFKVLNERYKRGGCTKEQLKRFVGLNALTPEEYKEITGTTYSEE